MEGEGFKGSVGARPSTRALLHEVMVAERYIGILVLYDISCMYKKTVKMSFWYKVQQAQKIQGGASRAEVRFAPFSVD